MAAPAYVTHAENNTNSSGTTLAFGAMNCAAGNLIVVCVTWMSGDSAISVSDTAGNTYTQVGGNVQDGTGRQYNAVLYAYNIAANASNTITVTWGTGRAYRSICAIQFSGMMSAASPLSDYDSAVTANTADPHNLAIDLTGASTGIVVFCCGSYTSTVWTYPTAGFASSGSESQTYAGQGWCYPVEGEQTHNYQVTHLGSEYAVVIGAIFKAASSSFPPPRASRAQQHLLIR